ncbi:hypothetical protein BC937DRAFT_87623, partial [Endogone sp. FLAS-F59071]
LPRPPSSTRPRSNHCISCSASLSHILLPFHLAMSWSDTALLQNATEILLSTHPLSPLLPNLTMLTVPPSTQFSVILNDTLPDGDDNPAYDPNTHLFLGICVSLGTSFVQSLGLAIQRKSYVLNENIHPKELRRNACQQPLWHVGFYTYLISNIIGSVFSIGYLPIVILAPIGAMGLVFNALFARILLGDAFTRQSVIGTILIVIGATLVGLFGVVPEPSHSLNDLIALYRRPAFISYFSVLETFTVVTLLVTHFTEYQLNLIQTGIIRESDTYLKKIGRLSKVRTILGISYGVMGGNISGQSMLFAKSGLELLILTLFHGQNQFDRPLTWVLVAFLIVTAILQLYYLNKGLRLCDTVLLIPLSFCAFNVSCLFNGLVYFGQWDRLRWWQILLVMIGICILITGVLILSWRSGGGGPAGPEEEFLTSSLSRNSFDDIDEEDEDMGGSGMLGMGVGLGGEYEEIVEEEEEHAQRSGNGEGSSSAGRPSRSRTVSSYREPGEGEGADEKTKLLDRQRQQSQGRKSRRPSSAMRGSQDGGFFDI